MYYSSFPSVIRFKRLYSGGREKGASRVSLAIVEVLDEVLCEAWGVVLDDLLGEVRVDGVDVLAQLRAWRSIDFLDSLEASALNECLLCLCVLGQHLSELGGDVSENIVGCEDEKWFER